MKNILLILFTITLIYGCEKRVVTFDDLNQVDGIKFKLKGKEGFYTGDVFELYENGEKKSMCTLIDGKLSGTAKEWYENGQLAAIGKYTDPVWPDDGLGSRDGTWYYWHENGVLGAVHHYKDGCNEGISCFWDSNLCFTGADIYLDDDQLLQVEYYPNLQLRSKQKYKSGLRIGAYNIWHENGQLQESYLYIDDKIEGELKEWDKNGKLLKIETYKTGKLVSKKTY